jgi:hypothetical protein
MSTDTKTSTTLDKLAQRRDELRVQMHLARAEARDEWDELEDKWHRLQHHLAPVGEASAETAKEIGAAAGLLMEEIWEGYGRIRDALRTRRAS